MKNNSFKISTARLAAICGVSQGTVDRALHNRKDVSPETREKILSVAREYGYFEASVNDNSRVIGIIVFDLFNSYFSELIMNIEEACKKAGYSVSVMFSKKDTTLEKRLIEQMYFMGAQGIIICPATEGEEFSRYLNSFKIPIVSVGNRLEGVPFIGIDDRSAMKELSSYVFSAGFKKAIYFAPVLKERNKNISAQRLRYEGFLAAAEELSVQHETAYNLSDIGSIGEDTALIAPTDEYALRLRIAYPSSPLVGFDNTAILSYPEFMIDSVDCGGKEVAKKAVEYIEGKSPDMCFIGHKIISRGSIKPSKENEQK